MLSIGNAKVNQLSNHLDRGSTPKAYIIFNEICLESTLESYNLTKSFQLEKLRCAICGSKIDKETLRSIIPRGAEIDLLCTNPYCIDEYFHQRAVR